ncbi:glycosyltransferase family 4 protein [Oceanobacillus caeni]
MKKILIISQNFYPEIGSAGNRMKNIYSLLKEKNFKIDVLTTTPFYPNRNFYTETSFWDDPELNKDSQVYRVKITEQRYSRKILNRLFYYLEMAIRMTLFVLFNRKKYDVIYATSPQIFVAIVGLIAKYRFRADFVLEIRDLWPESLKGVGVFNYAFIINFFTKIENLLYKKASKIVVNSQGFINYISSKSEKFADKIVYIPNGARKKEINYSNIPNGFKAIYVGNIGLAQDDDIIKKLALELNNRNIELTIMGYGLKRDELKDFIKENQLKNVNFVKPTTRKECFKIISKHQVGIVTLVNQDVFKTVLPGRVIDFMTCGVPMVASVSGLSREIILNEKVGFVSDSQNVEELIGYIEQLKDDKKLQKGMSENGKKFVEENFLWEKNINSLIKILT